MAKQRPWRLPTERAHALAGSAGALSFVGGAADFDHSGAIRSPNDLDAQIAGALENADQALEQERCNLEDAIRVKAFYLSDGTVDEWLVLAALARAFDLDPPPVFSTVPVPVQRFAGQAVQIQLIAQRGWRDLNDVRTALWPVPDAHRDRFEHDSLSDALRAGEMIALANRTGHAAGADPVAQSHAIMRSLADGLGAVGASLQDSVKLEGCYFRTNRAEWAPLALARASHFREPGPPATMVPCHALWPPGALTKIDVLAMRAQRNDVDKYIPRADCWPERVWDWPIELPYRQSISLRDTIWLGGQVPSEPFSNSGERVAPGDLAAQTGVTMGT